MPATRLASFRHDYDIDPVSANAWLAVNRKAKHVGKRSLSRDILGIDFKGPEFERQWKLDHLQIYSEMVARGEPIAYPSRLTG